MKVLIVIPAYNEERTLEGVLSGLKELEHDIVVVNDGSVDNTGQVAAASGVKVLTHVMNRGYGAAIGTGLEFARMQSYDCAVTCDADGQHRAEDIKNLIAPIGSGDADVVIGSRFLRLEEQKTMPWHRFVAIKAANVLTFLLFGKYVSDSQSGFRAYGRAAIDAIRLQSKHMEVSSEIIKEISRCKLRLKEVPIVVEYNSYSLSKGQNFFEGLRTAAKLLLQRLR